MILICYDGSEDARAALEKAAELFPSQPAVVLSVWEPFVEVAARTGVGFGLVPSFPDSADIDAASRDRANELAREGVELAQRAGLEAQPAVCEQIRTTGRSILAEAERRGAAAVVMGSRGLTGLRSLLLGSVSHEVIQRADRTIVVVPSASVAASRARAVGEEASAD